VEDLSRAGRGAGEVFHAGGGSALEVREVVAVVLEAAGRADLVPRYAPERPAHERQATWLDSTKLHTATGWAPGVSPVEGLQRTVREAR
jgi:nucleoside-diphosphate-sugar epimerase